MHKKKAHTTINKYIILILILTNTLNIITASFTTYILTSEIQKAKAVGAIPEPGVRVTTDHEKRQVGLILDKRSGLDQGHRDVEAQNLQHTHDVGAQDLQNKPWENKVESSASLRHGLTHKGLWSI